MILPRNGRIAIIDDKTEEEALPLLKALYKDGFSTVYFSGESSELPPEPLKDIRIVFLDMELVPGSDVQTKAAATANILSHVIDMSAHRFYFLIIWATHDELLAPFWRYIGENPDYQCLFLTTSLDKSECSARDYDISFIKDEIERKLIGNDGFQFLMGWENIIHKSSNDVINEFLSLIKSSSDLNKQLLGVFKKLAEAYAGENLNEDSPTQISQSAMLAFNGTFTDSLENNILNITNMGISFEDATGVTDNDVIAKINSKLLLSHGISSVKPGNIYEGDNKLIDSLINDLFNEPSSVDTSLMKIVFCEVSPFCDYAQNNWRVHRIIYGLIIPLESAKKIKKKAEFVYISPAFEIGGGAKKLVFNLRNIESVPIGGLKSGKPIFTLRHDLLVVIQHKIASHCSRPGMLSL